MAGLGGVMVLAAMLGLFFNKKNKISSKPWLLKALIWMIPMPFIANTAGWIMTEIGRQPWTVMGLYTTAQSVSPNVSAGDLLFSNIVFCGSYLILGGIMVYMVIRLAKKGPYEQVEAEEDVDLLSKEAFGK